MITVTIDTSIAIFMATTLMGMAGWLIKELARLSKSINMLSETTAILTNKAEGLREDIDTNCDNIVEIFQQQNLLHGRVSKIEGKCEVNH